MTKAEAFRSQTERTGHRKHASLRKPKKAAWGRDKPHAQAKATHALEDSLGVATEPDRYRLLNW